MQVEVRERQLRVNRPLPRGMLVVLDHVVVCASLAAAAQRRVEREADLFTATSFSFLSPPTNDVEREADLIHSGSDRRAWGGKQAPPPHRPQRGPSGRGHLFEELAAAQPLSGGDDSLGDGGVVEERLAAVLGRVHAEEVPVPERQLRADSASFGLHGRFREDSETVPRLTGPQSFLRPQSGRTSSRGACPWAR